MELSLIFRVKLIVVLVCSYEWRCFFLPFAWATSLRYICRVFACCYGPVCSIINSEMPAVEMLSVVSEQTSGAVNPLQGCLCSGGLSPIPPAVSSNWKTAGTCISSSTERSHYQLCMYTSGSHLTLPLPPSLARLSAPASTADARNQGYLQREKYTQMHKWFFALILFF